MEVWELEYQHTDYRHDQAVCVELQQAVRNRHWSPERLAQATALPVERVLKHLGGELEPSTDELARYSAALGLSREKLLVKAALEGADSVRTDRRASLLAVQELLVIWRGSCSSCSWRSWCPRPGSRGCPSSSNHSTGTKRTW